MYTATTEGNAASKSYHLVVEIYVGSNSAHPKSHTEGSHCIILVFEYREESTQVMVVCRV
jgi:hypothetical protein